MRTASLGVARGRLARAGRLPTALFAPLPAPLTGSRWRVDPMPADALLDAALAALVPAEPVSELRPAGGDRPTTPVGRPSGGSTPATLRAVTPSGAGGVDALRGSRRASPPIVHGAVGGPSRPVHLPGAAARPMTRPGVAAGSVGDLAGAAPGVRPAPTSEPVRVRRDASLAAVLRELTQPGADAVDRPAHPAAVRTAGPADPAAGGAGRLVAPGGPARGRTRPGAAAPDGRRPGAERAPSGRVPGPGAVGPGVVATVAPGPAGSGPEADDVVARPPARTSASSASSPSAPPRDLAGLARWWDATSSLPADRPLTAQGDLVDDGSVLDRFRDALAVVLADEAIAEGVEVEP